MAADKVIHMCSYRIPIAFRGSRCCLNRARWLVEWTTPEQPGMDRMRHRERSTRCYHHVANKFLPKDATQITTVALGYEDEFAYRRASSPSPERPE